MKGFKIAIATKDKDLEDLIVIGTDITGDDHGSESDKSEASMIESVDVFFDTVDNDVKTKQDSMLAKVTIKGKITDTPALTKKLRKLSEWAYDYNSETIYRDICIAVKASGTDFQVVYTLKSVFVVDYKELYGVGKDMDRFELRLTQRENHMDEIEILSDWPADWEWARKG